MATTHLEMTGITKRFPGVLALDDVSFRVTKGQVHALLGENGAGKSTLLKILAGAQEPDRGTIKLDGRPVRLAMPQDAQRQGIATIYQEFNLIPSLSVAENIFVGREPLRMGLVDWRAMAEEARAIIAEVGLSLEPMTLVSDLSVAEQQMVEIAKALAVESSLIIMDEPTSALSDTEVSRLFDLIRALKAKGISIIFVTHRLEEVMQICGAVTVLRDGRLVGSAPISEVTVDGLVAMMVGRDLERLFEHRAAHRTGDTVLRVEGLLTGRDPANPHATRLSDVSLTVRRGEILGLAGLVGAGRTELARALFGADARTAGTIQIDGENLDARSPEDAIRAGIGLVPEDRKQQALFLALAVRANMSIAVLDRFAAWLGFVDQGAEAALVKRYRERLNVRMADPEQAIGNLSGGNQQKVVLARWLALEPKVLIVDEPTRGIDVAAKAEVHQLLFELADTGIAILAISSELPEILTLSDRIVTMREGRITGEVPAAEASEERLMTMMTLNRMAA